MNDGERIACLKKEMKRCRSPLNGLLPLTIGFGAIGAYLVGQDSDMVLLIGGIIATLWGAYWWAITRRLYLALLAVYKAELDAAESHR